MRLVPPAPVVRLSRSDGGWPHHCRRYHHDISRQVKHFVTDGVRKFIYRPHALGKPESRPGVFCIYIYIYTYICIYLSIYLSV